MSVCSCCGREPWCDWAGCERKADVILHATRPCGHFHQVTNSCDPCADRRLADGGKAGRATSCVECGEVRPVEMHRAKRLADA